MLTWAVHGVERKAATLNATTANAANSGREAIATDLEEIT